MKKGGDNFVLCHDLSPRLKERIETNLPTLKPGEYRQAYPYSMDVPNLQNPPEKIVKRTSS
jgi:hypothetical protein